MNDVYFNKDQWNTIHVVWFTCLGLKNMTEYKKLNLFRNLFGTVYYYCCYYYGCQIEHMSHNNCKIKLSIVVFVILKL